MSDENLRWRVGIELDDTKVNAVIQQLKAQFEELQSRAGTPGSGPVTAGGVGATNLATQAGQLEAEIEQLRVLIASAARAGAVSPSAQRQFTQAFPASGQGTVQNQLDAELAARETGLVNIQKFNSIMNQTRASEIDSQRAQNEAAKVEAEATRQAAADAEVQAKAQAASAEAATAFERTLPAQFQSLRTAMEEQVVAATRTAEELSRLPAFAFVRPDDQLTIQRQAAAATETAQAKQENQLSQRRAAIAEQNTAANDPAEVELSAQEILARRNLIAAINTAAATMAASNEELIGAIAEEVVARRLLAAAIAKEVSTTVTASDVGTLGEGAAATRLVADRVKAAAANITAGSEEELAAHVDAAAATKNLAAVTDLAVVQQKLANGELIAADADLVISKKELAAITKAEVASTQRAKFEQDVTSGAQGPGSFLQRLQASSASRSSGNFQNPNDFRTGGQLVQGALLTTGRFAISTAAVYGLFTGVRQVVSESSALDKQLALINSELTATGQANQFDKVRSDILSTARATGVAGSAVATLRLGIEGAFAGKSQGFIDQQVKSAVEFKKVASLSDDDLKNSLVAVSTTFDASFSHIGDVVQTLHGQFGVASKDILEFAANSGAAAKASGASVEQTAAIGAAISKFTGAAGTSSAESFNRILATLQKQGANIVTTFSGAGFTNVSKNVATLLNQGDRFGALIAVLDNLKKLSPGDQQALVSDIGGRRDAKTLDALIQSLKELDQINKQISNNPADFGAGRLADDFKKLQGTVGQQLSELKQDAIQLGIALLHSGILDFFHDLLLVATPVVSFLAHLVQLFTSIPGAAKAVGVALTALALNNGFRLLAGGVIGAGGATSAAGGLSGGAGAGVSGISNPLLAGVAAGQFGGGTVPAATAAANSAAATEGITAAGLLAGGKALGGNLVEGMGGFLKGPGGVILGSLLISAVASHFKNNSGNGVADPKGIIQGTLEGALIGNTIVPGGFGAAVGGGIGGISSPIDRAFQGLAKANADKKQAGQDQIFTVSKVPYQTLSKLIQKQQDELFNDVKSNPFGNADIGPTKQLLNNLLNRKSQVNTTGTAKGIQAELKQFSTKQIAKLADQFGGNINDIVDKAASGALLSNKDSKKLHDFASFIAARGHKGTLEAIKQWVEDERTGKEVKDKAAKAAKDAADKVDAALTAQAASDAPGALAAGTIDVKTALARIDAQIDNDKAVIASGLNDAHALHDAAVNIKARVKIVSDNLRGQADLIVQAANLQGGPNKKDGVAAAAALTQLLENPKFTDPGDVASALTDLYAAYGTIVQNQVDAATSAAEKLRIATTGIKVPRAVQIVAERAALLTYNAGFLSTVKAIAKVTGDNATSIETGIATIAVDTGKTIHQATDIFVASQISALNNIKKVLDNVNVLNVFGPVIAEINGTIANLNKLKNKADRDPSLNFTPPVVTTVTGHTDPGAAAKDIAQQQKDLLAAQTNLLKAQVANNPVALADADIAAAHREIEAAAAETDKIQGRIDGLNAQADLINAQRAKQQALNDIVNSQENLVIAILNAAGNTVGAAREQVKATQKQIDQAIASGAGGTAVNNLRATLVQQSAALRDAVLNDQLSDIQFLLDTQKISEGQALARLKVLAQGQNLTKQQRQQILEQIHQIEADLGQDLQFNIPSNIDLPTLYETRRLTQSGFGQGTYQQGRGTTNNDNRNITISLYASDQKTANAAADKIIKELNSPTRNGAYNKKY